MLALIAKEVPPDRGHDTKCPGVVKDENGRSARTNALGGAHDAALNTPKCKKKGCKASGHFNSWRSTVV